MAQICSICLRDNFGNLTQSKTSREGGELPGWITTYLDQKAQKAYVFLPTFGKYFKVWAPVTFRTLFWNLVDKISWSTLQVVQNWDPRSLARTQLVGRGSGLILSITLGMQGNERNGKLNQIIPTNKPILLLCCCHKPKLATPMKFPYLVLP